MPGAALQEAYRKSAPELVEKGCENLIHHINIIRTAGINPVVCINRFPTDTDEEIAIIRRTAEAMGVRCAVLTAYSDGGEGALELALEIKKACLENPGKRVFPGPDTPLERRQSCQVYTLPMSRTAMKAMTSGTGSKSSAITTAMEKGSVIGWKVRLFR